MNDPSDGAYVGKHAGSFKDEPEPPRSSWWEILRDHWYIDLIMLGIGLGSRLAGVPTWLGTVVGVAIYAAVVRGWRWWRRRQGPTEDPRAELDGEGGTG